MKKKTLGDLLQEQHPHAHKSISTLINLGREVHYALDDAESVDEGHLIDEDHYDKLATSLEVLEELPDWDDLTIACGAGKARHYVETALESELIIPDFTGAPSGAQEGLVECLDAVMVLHETHLNTYGRDSASAYANDKFKALDNVLNLLLSLNEVATGVAVEGHVNGK